MSQDETDPFKSQERGGWIMLKMMWRKCELEAGEIYLWIQTSGDWSWRRSGSCMVRRTSGEEWRLLYHKLPFLHTQTHTHTHIYIYIYIYQKRKPKEKCRVCAQLVTSLRVNYFSFFCSTAIMR
jgi:hypothetical protein